jgi:2,4-dienoyl-CoA reductase-like NADH-dependent reductase (Old Yellow Enzyme family)
MMSNTRDDESKLFSPFPLSGMRLRNRIVRAAVFEKRADDNGAVTPELLEWYREAASGGPGLIITGGALVHPTGRTLKGMISAHADSFTAGLTRLAGEVHGAGGLIGLQLFHGGRHCPPKAINWEAPLAPSALHDTATDSTPKKMADSEIWEIVEAFGAAAFRARAAGFDAVQIHAGHGYLISSFLSPRTNLRDDYWGGDEERRGHFAEEVLKAVRGAVGPGFPVIVKMNGDDHMHGGIEIPEAARSARRL